MAANKQRMPRNLKIFVGSQALHVSDGRVEGEFTQLDGESFYRIRHFDGMPPFFMSVVSHSNHWMFISSNGALTCGRRSPEDALFPYTTDDKIHDAAGQVGPLTMLLVESGEGDSLWEPFSDRYEGVYDIERSLYKNTPGNKLVFEEINRTLNLSFCYTWLMSDRYGFVRRAKITNLGTDGRHVRLIDGLRNLLPANVDRALQNSFSTLVDAYKKSELLPDSGIGIYSLSSVPVDRAEPSESLLANTVWSVGFEQPTHLLSDRQLDAFRRGEEPVQEDRARGIRGAYFVSANLDVRPRGSREWFLVAEVNQDASAIAELERTLGGDDDLAGRLLSDVAEGTDELNRIVSSADGIQSGGDPLQAARHFSNTLFNVMRGGVFDDDYRVSKADLFEFLQTANRPAAEQIDWEALPDLFDHAEGLAFFEQLDNPDLLRLYFEYLPLTFSRRHGDPSRPWNAFSIETRNLDGSRKLSYQGNWRDIFQNWEALGISYPGFLESMIFKFANASTADGYNPYRITRDGIDWEVHDPDDPWSYIGYWGDHQIVYLLKLLEHCQAYHPGRLKTFLGRQMFAYANVPYRIKPYQSLLANPQDTIEFDRDAHEAAISLAARIGSDGKLVHGPDGSVLRVNLTEKLVVPLLAKLSNLIADGGIWMNTQRPEWNDANNALVGSGVSMVTLCYIRRYLEFCLRLFKEVAEERFVISAAVVDQFRDMFETLKSHRTLLTSGFTPHQRRALLDGLGGAGSRYRDAVYHGSFSDQKSALPLSDLIGFLELSRQYVDQSIANNRREDGLYHAYNLMQVDADGGVSIGRLDEMLEGQVAVLSSGKLDTAESLSLLQSLRGSALYRADQHSYLLYPDRELPRFTEKNCIPEGALTDSDPRIVSRDCCGKLHFHPSLRNARELQQLMDELELPDQQRQEFLAVYEAVFNHRSFTGRSGTFFKYEGLGCIYWHMVSKLLLAVAERCMDARRSGQSSEVIQKLIDCYHDIRAGIGAHKSVIQQGAFPTDPYSHTPAMMGAQQPGLTGQVKEDFIARLLELGVRVENGCLCFDSFLLPDSEISGEPLNFTVCTTPVTLATGARSEIRVLLQSGETVIVEGLALDAEISQQIFQRRGTVKSLQVAQSDDSKRASRE